LLGILWAWRRHVAFVAAESETQPRAIPPAPFAASRAGDTGITVAPMTPTSAPDRKATVGRGELIVLSVLSVLCLAAVAFALPHSLAQLDLWGKMLLMFSAGLWMATLHTLCRRWTAAPRFAVKPGLPGEGVLLWTMLLVGAVFSAT